MATPHANRTLGGSLRYEPLVRIASGGMATVFVGRMRGALGFRQLVALKQPHPHLLLNPEFRRELVTEARLASLIHHAHVVDVRDVDLSDGELLLVMDYIEGGSVGDLLVNASKGGPAVTVDRALRIALDALSGLHAAHELADEAGVPMGLVHRDISPQNILVGTDGLARVSDFGVAKFVHVSRDATTDGALKGKLAYMPPEYVRGRTFDRRFDVFSMGVVLWEMLAGRRLYRGKHDVDTMRKVLEEAPPSLAELVSPSLAPFDPLLAVALAKDPADRFQTAAAMATALEGASEGHVRPAGHREVAELVKASMGPVLAARRDAVRARIQEQPASEASKPPVATPAIPTAPMNVVPEATAATQAAPPTNVPTTAPMADGRPAPTTAVPVTQPTQSTLPLEGAGRGPAPLLPPMVAAPSRTLASAPEAGRSGMVRALAPDAHTLHSEGSLSAFESSGPAASAVTSTVAGIPSRSSRWLFAAVPVVAVAILAGAALVWSRAQGPAPVDAARPPVTVASTTVPAAASTHSAAAVTSSIPSGAPTPKPTAKTNRPPVGTARSRPAGDEPPPDPY